MPGHSAKNLQTIFHERFGSSKNITWIVYDISLSSILLNSDISSISLDFLFLLCIFIPRFLCFVIVDFFIFSFCTCTNDSPVHSIFTLLKTNTFG